MSSRNHCGNLYPLFKVCQNDLQKQVFLFSHCDNTAHMSSCVFVIRVEFTQLAAAYSKVNLGQGFPDFAPPKFVQEAFCHALNGGPMMHQYTRAFVSEQCPFTGDVTALSLS